METQKELISLQENLDLLELNQAEFRKNLEALQEQIKISSDLLLKPTYEN